MSKISTKDLFGIDHFIVVEGDVIAGTPATEKGRADMQKIFGDMNNNRPIWFWTSSALEEESAYVFNTNFFESEFRSDSRGSVRCVFSK